MVVVETTLLAHLSGPQPRIKPYTFRISLRLAYFEITCWCFVIKRLLASLCPSVHPSVFVEQLGSHWTDFFNEIWYLGICQKSGARGVWLRHCPTSQKVVGSISDGVIGIFHWLNSFRPHYGPGVDSASKRNEYQDCFLGVKAAGA